MSAFKVKPPPILESEGLTEASFNIWIDQLETYLESCDLFDKFMPGGRYPTWLSKEDNEQRILAPIAPNENANLPTVRKHLKRFITTIARNVHQD